MRSDVEELMPQLLPVEECGDGVDVDLSAPPRNPQEYLRQVQLEASRYPDVIVAQIDPRKLTKRQTVSVPLTGCCAAPEGFSPEMRWQELQVSNFSEVRQSIAKHRARWSETTLDENVILPRSDDEEGWMKFCLGEYVYHCTAPTPGDTQNPGLDYVKVGFPPFLSIVSRLNQALVASVLDYLINWFGEKEFVPQLGRWLYALLACLEKPLLPEVHSLIRQLARRCSELRAGLESKDDEKLSALNLIICLVGRYFEQNDLADN